MEQMKGKKKLLDRALSLAEEAINALAKLLERTGKVTFNNEIYADDDEEEPEEGWDGEVYISVLQEEGVIHEHIIKTIAYEMDKGYGYKVFKVTTYDPVDGIHAEPTHYNLLTHDAYEMCRLYDEVYTLAWEKGLLDDDE